MRVAHPLLTLAASVLALSARAGEVPATSPDWSAKLRLEHFALQVLETPPRTSRDLVMSRGRTVGLVAWRRRRVADGIQLECESTFADDEHRSESARVLHVEQLTDAGPRLVWREIGRGGRALRAEWSRDGENLRVIEWSASETRRESVGTGKGAVMPLYLLELARTGRITAGSFLRFDPLVRGLDLAELCTSYEVENSTPENANAGAMALRAVELRRSDGTSAGRYVFRGSELCAFQWQESDVWAVRISPEEYDRRAAELAPREPLRGS